MRLKGEDAVPCDGNRAYQIPPALAGSDNPLRFGRGLSYSRSRASHSFGNEKALSVKDYGEGFRFGRCGPDGTIPHTHTF